MSAQPERLLTYQELGDLLGFSAKWVYLRVKAGLIHPYPLPCLYGCPGTKCEHQRAVRFKLSDVEAEMKRRAMTAA